MGATLQDNSKVIDFHEALHRRHTVTHQMLGPRPYHWKQRQAGKLCYLIRVADKALIEAHITSAMPDVIRELDIISSLITQDTAAFSSPLKENLAIWLAMYVAITCTEKLQNSIQQHVLVRREKALADRRFQTVQLTQGKTYTAESLMRTVHTITPFGSVERIYR